MRAAQLPMAPSDEALIAQYRQGDGHAFRVLVDRYTAPIYNLAFRLLDDSMEAENVTQEAFLRVVSALNHLRLDMPFKPYLFRIALNLCRDFARKKRPVLFSDLQQAVHESEEPTVEMIPDVALALWEQIEEKELGALLQAAVDRLPGHYRAVITLRYVEGFSYEEIAQALSIPMNTVRTHLRRAKQQLRVDLEKGAPAVSSGRGSPTEPVVGGIRDA